MVFENKVKNAVALAGGPTYTATKLGVTPTAIHSMIRKERVSSIDKARLLSKLSGVALLDLRPC